MQTRVAKMFFLSDVNLYLCTYITMIGMEANKIAITDEALRRGAEEGMDGFLKVFIDKYLEVTGGVVNAETMPLLNGYQHSFVGVSFLA